jgi:hypothetical protein
MSTFTASVQYNDKLGTAAADRADQNDLNDYLEKKGLINHDEFVLATSLWVGENHGGKLGHVFVTAYLFKAVGYQNVDEALRAIDGPIPVRTVSLEVTLEEFVAFFKRFEVFLAPKGLNVTGREFKEI